MGAVVHCPGSPCKDGARITVNVGPGEEQIPNQKQKPHPTDYDDTVRDLAATRAIATPSGLDRSFPVVALTWTRLCPRPSKTPNGPLPGSHPHKPF